MHHLTTILDWIRYSTTRLSRADIYYGHGTDNALDEAAALVLGLLSLPYDLSETYFCAHLTEEEQKTLAEGLRQRLENRLPVPYITKQTLYGGLTFYIDQRALIPRSPIAELLEKGLAPYWNEETSPPDRILDLCCGSGCLGILAKYHFPAAEIVLADIDQDALDVAYINVDRFGLLEEIEIVQSDLFAQVEGKFDLIICNPPYVEAQEMAGIAVEFLHEPELALVSGEDGLDATRKILRSASEHLTERGLLILEVGMSWQILEEAFPEVDFGWVEFERGGEGVCVITADELQAWQLAGII